MREAELLRIAAKGNSECLLSCRSIHADLQASASGISAVQVTLVRSEPAGNGMTIRCSRAG